MEPVLPGNSFRLPRRKGTRRKWGRTIYLDVALHNSHREPCSSGRGPPLNTQGQVPWTLGDVEDDGGVVHGAPGQHEEVPDAVEVPEALVEEVEHDARGVDDAAAHDPGEARP